MQRNDLSELKEMKVQMGDIEKEYRNKVEEIRQSTPKLEMSGVDEEFYDMYQDVIRITSCIQQITNESILHGLGL